MAQFVKGDIVVIPFPFSDLSGSKRRPALVLSDLPGDDILLCQITSQPFQDVYAIPINSIDFVSGSLPVASFIKPFRIFTADKSLIIRKVGTVKHTVISSVTQTVIKLLQ